MAQAEMMQVSTAQASTAQALAANGASADEFVDTNVYFYMPPTDTNYVNRMSLDVPVRFVDGPDGE